MIFISISDPALVSPVAVSPISPLLSHLFLEYLSQKWQHFSRYFLIFKSVCLSAALKIVPVSVSGSVLLCNGSIGVLHPLVPELMRRKDFDNIYKIDLILENELLEGWFQGVLCGNFSPRISTSGWSPV